MNKIDQIKSLNTPICGSQGDTGVKEKTIIKEKEKIDFKFEKPKQYRVIMHNNDYTAFAAVVDVLKAIFNINNQTAQSMMMFCHAHGFAQIMVSTRETCDLKVEQAHAYCESKSGTGNHGRGGDSDFYEYMRFSVEEMPHT
jgi:ATP-dependent Clp protease adaptor protein ClpS